MFCPVCKNTIPDENIACRNCVDRKAREDMLRIQERYIESLLAGKRALKVAIARSKPHLILFGDEHHSWCWEFIAQPKWRHETYDDELRRRICEKCALSFRQVAAAEARHRAVAGS